MHDGIKGILESGKFPGVVRMSNGPGSCNNEMIFDRPDPQKDIPLTLKVMEAHGKLKDPDTMAAAESKMEEARTMPKGTLDYQKEGHPLDN